MLSLKSILLLIVFLIPGLFIGCVSNVSAAAVTVGQTASKASSTYFYYAPGARNAYSVINSAINAAASGATAGSHGVVNVENASGPYITDSHILAKSNVDIVGQSRGGVKFKIAGGITPQAYNGPGSTGWGGTDSANSDGALVNVWENVSNVKIANITLDGSCGDYYSCGNEERGKAEFPLLNIYHASNVLVDNVKFTQGRGDGIIFRGSNLEVANSRFDMIGHDFIEGYNITNLKFHNNIGAMRTNSGVRCSGSGSSCLVYDNEFYTGSGGGAGLELQDAFTNVKVYNNYFHDISGANGSYGAIGYPGQSPSGSGHEYYNNLFVNMPYAVAHVPSSAVSRNNIMINCSTTVGGGSDQNNIKTASGYVFAKYGANGQGNTYWTVTSGSLASSFSGMKIGIRTQAGGSDGTTTTQYVLTVNSGLGGGSFAAGTAIDIIGYLPAAGKDFDRWTGDTGYVSSATSYLTTVTMPAKAITLTATYKDFPVTTYALTVSGGSGSGSYAAGTRVTITAAAPASGKVFDKWTGSTAYITSTTSATTTVTMPSSAITLTATYKTAPVTTYTLTVSGGTGSGSYAAGTKVTITAAAAPSGKVFDKWTGSTNYIAGTTSAITTVTMPSSAVTLTATYKTATATTYVLTVTNGSGDGSYAAATTVTITADAPPTGKVFDKWTGDTTYLSSIYTPAAIVTIPTKAITLTATYKTAVATTYALTVTNGTGDGSYAPATNITITADAPTSGKVFDKWTGDITYLSSIYTSIASVTMPAKAITLIATYKTAAVTTYTLTINSGNGTGSYISGSTVIIIANAPATGKVFDKWTGDISYVSNASSLISAVTMPTKAITLTANYKSITTPVTTYALTVTNGTGDGSYTSGTSTTITADAPPSGKVFDKWTGDTTCLASATSSTTTVTMPTKAITLTATYKATTIYPTGTLIRISLSPKVYVIIDGAKKWISTPEVFEQLGYKWTNIIIVTELDLGKYSDFEDNLIRAINGYQVFLVVSGIRRHIPNPGVFLNYGFSWNDVKDVNQSTIDKYKDTYLIRASKTTAVYYLTNGIKKLIPTADIFNSYNDKWTDVQIISPNEMNAYPTANLIKLGNSSDVYLIEGTIKRRIPSIAVFNKYRYDWNYVMTVNQTEFNYYKTGAEVK